jgi:RNA polymerase sigma-70 factor (ECF subfamily)
VPGARGRARTRPRSRRVPGALMPDGPQARGLLALMLLRSARRAAGGDLIPLEEQDRGLWDQGQIAECENCSSGRCGWAGAGPFQIQAAIAVLPWLCAAGSPDRLAAHRRPLCGASASGSYAGRGPEPGCRDRDGGWPGGRAATAGRTRRGRRADRVPLRPAARADLLRRARRGDEARASYQAALGLAPAGAERHYPQRRRCDLCRC